MGRVPLVSPNVSAAIARPLDDLIEVRRQMLETGEIPEDVRPVVADSWKRSVAYGVDPLRITLQAPPNGRLEADGDAVLLQAALPHLEAVHLALADRSHLVALSDSDGNILRLLGDDESTTLGLAANLFEGASWHERDIGSNGIGTALATGEPVLLIGPEHFQEAYQTWTCIGVPLRLTSGEVVGAVDLSVPNEEVGTHTWGWMLSIARLIERAMAQSKSNGDGREGTGLPRDLIFDDLDKPFHSVRGILRLLASQVDLSPSHAELVAEAASNADAAYERLQFLRGEARDATVSLSRSIVEQGNVAARADELEAQLQEKGRLLDAVMTFVPEGITIAQAPDVRIVMVSDHGRRLTGRSATDIEGIASEEHASAWRIYHRDGRALATADELPLTRAVKDGIVVENEEWVLERADGERLTISCNAGPIRDEEGNITGGLIAWRDVSDLTEMRNALRRAEERFRVSLRSVPVVVSHCDLDLRYTWIYNPLHGFRPEEVLGRRDDELLPEDEVRDLISFKQSVLDSGRPARREMRLADAGQRRVYEIFAEPLRDAEGTIEGLTVAAIDVTSRKLLEMELQQANERLEEKIAERTAELEARNDELQQFVYVASHDMREPLRKIKTFGGLMKTDYGDVLDEEGLSYLGRMEGAASRLMRLLDDLLQFSRVETHGYPFETVRVGEAVQHVLDEVTPLLRERGIRVEVEADVVVEADRDQLGQLLLELVSNAAAYSDERRPNEIRITAGIESGGDGHQVCLMTVEDSGIGIEERFLSRIFEPFQRLHGRHKYGGGTGMGLAICRRIVARHKGSIHAESTPGEGTRIFVRLPLEQTDG